MVLPTGTRLGPYEITAPLGAGGMGEVYRARDTKLGREVALKVLPADFAADPERLARFEREARTLAALNHPHIAQVYGFEEGPLTPSTGSGQALHLSALVMELVPGESLAVRLARAPLSMRDALDLARQIADGLEGAHEKGIVHRDLKPANVQVTPDGKVKILDFGLAKPVAADEASGSAADAATITSPAQMTQAGIVLGTAAYMSPEQARGLAVDTRTDVWAFGGVLYEMLTGTRAFPGPTVTDLLAQILERDPDWTKLPAATPGTVRALVQRCLRKEPRQRLHDIADARFGLEDALVAMSVTASGIASATSGPLIAAPAPPAIWRHPLPLGLALVTLGLGGALAWSLSRTPAPRTREPQHLSLMLPPGQGLINTYVAISPNGQDIVYAAVAEEGSPGEEGGVARLYHRRLSEPSSRPLRGTEGAMAPSFSPDGEWILFHSPTDLSLKKIALSGGGPLMVAEAIRFNLGSGRGRWTESGQILFGDSLGPIRSVSAAGGTPDVVVPRSALQETEYGMIWPVALPGNRGTLFQITPAAATGIAAWVDGQRRMLIKGGDQPLLAPTGHLLFSRRTGAEQVDLTAVAFDRDRVQVAGTPIPVLSVEAAFLFRYDLSQTGTLVYRSATQEFRGGRFAWLARDERRVPPLPPAPPGDQQIFNPRVAPDGRHVLYALSAAAAGSDTRHVLVDLASGSSRMLALGAGFYTAWSHDGRRLIHQASPESPGGGGMLWTPADGSGPPERLTASKGWQQPQATTRDGRFLVYQESAGLASRNTAAEDNYDIWILPLAPRSEPRPFLRTQANERLPHVSADQRWMAYVSDESGRDEVWVRGFPDGHAVIRITQDGGTEPVWAPDGRTLYYRDSAGARLFAVPVSGGPVPQFGTPVVTNGYWTRGLPYTRMYDITPDGSALLMLPASTLGRELHVVLNFDEVIQRKMREGK